jgi:hypothetical protein
MYSKSSMGCSRSLLLDVWVRILDFAALVGGTLVLAFVKFGAFVGGGRSGKVLGRARAVDAAIHVRKNWTSRLCACTV